MGASEKNDFLLVSQFSGTGALYTCRPDLLGFVNADHLAVVQSASRDLPVVGVLLPDDRVPRTLLVLAAVEIVDITLRGRPTIRPEGGAQTP